MMGKMLALHRNKAASIGIGALIIFIALVLIAGMAASVIIQTSSKLETQTLQTGRDTQTEVSTGVDICTIEGYTTSNTEDISKLAIMVRPRSGTDFIDLSAVFVELSNSTVKIILNYTDSYYAEPDGLDNIFGTAVFPDTGTTGDSTKFGILVFEDADDSMSSTIPLMNRGDKAFLCINTTAAFNDIPERVTIWGNVIPEEGFGGAIKFITPSTYADNVMELQR